LPVGHNEPRSKVHARRGSRQGPCHHGVRTQACLTRGQLALQLLHFRRSLLRS
jgi:hypothetical protein